MDDDGVDILDDATLEVVDHCDGPAGGRCPHAGADGVVACAGRRIDPLGGPPEYTRLQVQPGTRQCPLNWNLESFGM
jgi:hypothetical protein